MGFFVQNRRIYAYAYDLEKKLGIKTVYLSCQSKTKQQINHLRLFSLFLYKYEQKTRNFIWISNFKSGM